MIHKSSQMLQETKEHVRGGEGAPVFTHLFSAGELGGRMSMLCRITLQPGESIGLHSHTDNAEAYYILSGHATVTEDDTVAVLQPGDAEFCADGHSHGIRNHTEEVTEILAMIVPNG